MARPRKDASTVMGPRALEATFFKHLWSFYEQNRKEIVKGYKDLTRKLLEFNRPSKEREVFLREPQFEALEVYVFLKEGLDNKPLAEVFDDWYHKRGIFERRGGAHNAGGAQLALGFDGFDEETYRKVFAQLRSAGEGSLYPNYIFALTMGTGKTILIATCIFYEFLLANKFPKDGRYAQNALVFAPDKTVLQSLKEIQEFDRSKVIPKEYLSVLNGLMNFHYLEDAGTTLNVLQSSSFNLIVSNAQKIILKRQHQGDTPQERLFQSSKRTYKPTGGFEEAAALYDFEGLQEGELVTNQRFEQLRRMGHLAIYIDEAHHAFGKSLRADLDRREATETSLRRSVDELAAALRRSKKPIVACHNFTGTPYAEGRIFPEVVYSFGLKEAIDEGYLKKVTIGGYTNSKSEEFVRTVLDDFFGLPSAEERFEGLTPKLAFFASTIEELNEELRPIVEDWLRLKGWPLSRMLINVGDDKLTSNDDLREFNRLDKPESEKRIILLVNKGKEGWNCRSLFGVALFRKPRSKVFVLQATMRCLRAIAHPPQRMGHVYLSQENMQILEDELNQNFRVNLQELRDAGSRSVYQDVVVSGDAPTLRIKRIRSEWRAVARDLGEVKARGVRFNFGEVDVERYKFQKVEQEGLDFDPDAQRRVDLSAARRQRVWSALSLSAEVGVYMNLSPLLVEELLSGSREGMESVLHHVNTYNELLYDRVIPKLHGALYEVRATQVTQEEDLVLIHAPKDGAYRFKAKPDLTVDARDPALAKYRGKSFHVSPYCFDSEPERILFEDMLQSDEFSKVYATGMFTQGQSDFYIEYIDPDAHAVRSYHPDFLVQTREGLWLIVEVKGENRLEEPLTKTKAEFARQMAEANGMVYCLLPTDPIKRGRGVQELLRLAQGGGAWESEGLQIWIAPLAPKEVEVGLVGGRAEEGQQAGLGAWGGSLPGWVLEVYEREFNREDGLVDRLAEFNLKVDELRIEERWDDLNFIMSRLDFDKIGYEFVVSLLGVTFLSRDKLDQWRPTARRLAEHRTSQGKPVRGLLERYTRA